MMKQKQTSKLLSVLLAVFMLAGMIPWASLSAWATVIPVAQIGETAYATVQEAFAAANAAESPTTIKLLANCTSGALTVETGKTVTLDLNGKTISYSGDDTWTSIISVSGTLTLVDSTDDPKTEAYEGTGAIVGNEEKCTRGVYVGLGGSFVMSGGTITGNCINVGGGVYVDGGTFRMDGGVISDNYATYAGGGVSISKNYDENVPGSFQMTGGEIRGNCADSCGGGVDVDEAAFVMTVGEIRGNCAGSYGGGVCVSEKGEFRLSGAPVIADNVRDGEKDEKTGLYVGEAADDVFLCWSGGGGGSEGLAQTAGRDAGYDDGAEDETPLYAKITVDGALTYKTPVAVTLDEDYGEEPFTSGWSTYMSGKTHANYFTNGEALCSVELDETAGELKMITSPLKPLAGVLRVAGVDLVADSDNTISTETPGVSGGTAAFTLDKFGNPVLTLTNFVYTGEGYAFADGPTRKDGGRGKSGADAAAILYEGELPLTIVLNGVSAVTQKSGDGDTPANSYGIYCNPKSGGFGPEPKASSRKLKLVELIVTGDGSLTVAGGKATTWSEGIRCECDFVVDAALTARGGEGAVASRGVKAARLMTVEEGARLYAAACDVTTVEVEYTSSCGLSCSEIVIDGALTAVAGEAGASEGYSTGVSCYGMTINKDGRLTAAAGNAEYSCGIRCDEYGEIVLKEDGVLAARGFSSAVDGKLKNAVAGKGCESVDGSEKWSDISVCADDEGQTLAHKLVLLPYAETVTVSFDGNGATGGTMAPQALPYNAPGTLTANAFTREGFVFAGWNTKADGTGESYADKANVTAAWPLTLYAQWMPAGSLEGGRVTALKDMVLIVAAYDATGRMTAAQVKTLDADCDGATLEQLGLNTPSGAYRLMLVNGSTFAPFCAAWYSVKS